MLFRSIRQKLPEGFQRSEFLVDHGMIDLVVDRRDLKATIARTLRFMRAGSTAASGTKPENAVAVSVAAAAAAEPVADPS